MPPETDRENILEKLLRWIDFEVNPRTRDRDSARKKETQQLRGRGVNLRVLPAARWRNGLILRGELLMVGGRLHHTTNSKAHKEPLASGRAMTAGSVCRVRGIRC